MDTLKFFKNDCSREIGSVCPHSFCSLRRWCGRDDDPDLTKICKLSFIHFAFICFLVFILPPCVFLIFINYLIDSVRLGRRTFLCSGSIYRAWRKTMEACWWIYFRLFFIFMSHGNYRFIDKDSIRIRKKNEMRLKHSDSSRHESGINYKAKYHFIFRSLMDLE